MTLAGILGGSNRQRSIVLNDERSLNLFPVVDQKGVGGGAMYGRPGLNLFGSVAIGPGRGTFTAANGRAFVVIGSMLYEVFANGTTNGLGSLSGSQGVVTIAENGLQLAVCDGVNLYIYTYATSVFAKVVNANLPSAATVTFIDGYFIVNRSISSGIFQISGLYDGFSWAALDFATAESSPDALLRVLNVAGQLWLLGARSIEIWSNVGALAFPFQRISGAKIETGVISPYAAISLDNSLFWCGTDVNGAGIVYRADGFSPVRISNSDMERAIQTAPDKPSIRFGSYQEDGQTFLRITGGGMETSWYYDLATQLPHERCYLNDDGIYEQELVADSMYAFDRQIAVDRRNGNIYEQSLNFFSDNGEEIACDRIFTHLVDELQRVRYSSLSILFETGVGNQIDPGSNPQATLFTSRNGGRTWGQGVSKSIGKVGDYKPRVIWNQLGQARSMTFRVRVTELVKVAMSGAWVVTQ